MTTREMQDEIIRLRKENNVCVLAHAYMSRDICEAADYVGDSFGLSKQAASSPAQTVIMCGVRFMAETVKILSPEKTVLLPNPNALCPMAEQIDAETLRELKKGYPGYTTVAYINTTAETKAEVVFNNKILRYLCIYIRRNECFLSGNYRTDIFYTLFIEHIFYVFCRTRCYLVDHGPRESNPASVIQIIDESVINMPFCAPCLGYNHN